MPLNRDLSSIFWGSNSALSKIVSYWNYLIISKLDFLCRPFSLGAVVLKQRFFEKNSKNLDLLGKFDNEAKNIDRNIRFPQIRYQKYFLWASPFLILLASYKVNKYLLSEWANMQQSKFTNKALESAICPQSNAYLYVKDPKRRSPEKILLVSNLGKSYVSIDILGLIIKFS